MRRVIGVALVLGGLGCLAGPAGAATASYIATAPVSGTFRVSWSGASSDPTLRAKVSAVATFAVEDRLRAPEAGAAWIDEPLLDFVAAELRRSYASYLRARVSLDAYTRTEDAVCQDGSAAHTTTAVAAIAQSHALLEYETPTLDLLAGRGEADVNLPFAVRRDGVLRTGQAVFGTGRVTTRTAGTDCSGGDADGVPTATPVDHEQTSSVADLMGGDVVAAVDDGFQAFALTVGPGGSTTMRGTHRLAGSSDPDRGLSFAGSLGYDLRATGSPRAQTAICTLPSSTRMLRARSLTAARALLRRAGLPSAVFGGDRPNSAPRGRFYLQSGSPYAACGLRLGTRKYPILFRSRGIVRSPVGIG